MQTSSVASASFSTSTTRSRSAPYASVIGPFSISARARSRRTLTSVRKSLMKCPLPRSWSRHRQHIQDTVELGFGDLALVDIPAFEHNLLDRLVFFQCLLRDLRRLVIADVVVERCDDRG